MALGTAPNEQKTSGRIDVNMTLPEETGFYVLGGGLLVFLVVLFMLRKFDKK